MLMIVHDAIPNAPVTEFGIVVIMLRQNCAVWSLNRFISLSTFSTVTAIRLHTVLGLVTMYHFYLPSFVFRSIDLEFYGLIVEKCVFALTKTGRVVVALETVTVVALVRAVKKSERIVRSMTVVSFALLLPSLSSYCLLLVRVPLILSDS